MLARLLRPDSAPGLGGRRLGHRAARAARIRRNEPDAIAPKSSATPVPRNSQITLLTWCRADRQVGRAAPSGRPSLSVTQQRDVVDAVSPVRALSRTVVRWPAAEVDAVAGHRRPRAAASVTALERDRHRLVEVVGDRRREPAAGARRAMTAVGRVDVDRLQASVDPVPGPVAREPAATPGWCRRRRTRSEKASSVTVPPTWSLSVSRFWSASPVRIRLVGRGEVRRRRARVAAAARGSRAVGRRRRRPPAAAMLRTSVRSSQSRRGPRRSRSRSRPGPSRGQHHDQRLAVARRAAAARPRRGAAAASRPTTSGSSGPGPPAAAPDEVTTSVWPVGVGHGRRRRVAEHPVGDAGPSSSGRRAEARRREVAARRRDGRAWWQPPGSSSVAPSARGPSGRAAGSWRPRAATSTSPYGRRQDLVSSRPRRAAGRASLDAASAAAARRARVGVERVARSLVGGVEARRWRTGSTDSSSASSPSSPSSAAGRAPSERGGLPSASRRTASSRAGSTSQVTGAPGAAPKSTSESEPPASESVCGPAGEVGEPAVGGSWRTARADRHDQRGVDRPASVFGTSGRKVRARPSATSSRPSASRRGRARRTSRRLGVETQQLSAGSASVYGAVSPGASSSTVS